MDAERLETRYAELEKLAADRGVDWESKQKDIPEADLAARIAALATLLELPIQRTFEDISLDQLTTEAAALAAADAAEAKQWEG